MTRSMHDTKAAMHDTRRVGERAPILAVGLLSGASLGFELLLLRWFAILYWHHFAHMIISMALLGFGVAGSILTVSQNVLLRRYNVAFRTTACAFALSTPLVVIAVGRIGFNPLQLVWEPGQGGRLALMFLVSAIPFIFSGFGIGLTMRRFPGRIAVLYRADLAGAAAGALATPVLLMIAAPQVVLRLLAAPALAAAWSASRHSGRRFRERIPWAPLMVVAVTLLWPAAMLRPVMSPYKDLPQTLRIPGMVPVAEQVSPAGIAIALKAGQVPFRQAPGLSMLSPAEPPDQIALFIDGHGAGAIADTSPSDAARDMAYLDWTTAALPYVLAPVQPRVLVLGAGGGTDEWHAYRADAVAIDAVEASGALLRVVDDVGAGYPVGVRRIEMEPRTFLAATRSEHDVIQISLFGTVAPYADAAQAMRENYLYTVEGIRLMLRRMSDQGILAITLPIDIPPRAPVKLLATWLAAAEHEGVGDVADRVAAIRSWNSVTMLIGRQALTAAQVEAIRGFCRERAFDAVWYPGMQAETANRVNVLDRPYFHEAARALLEGDRESYLRHYPFHVRPATDDQPYFGRFFRWRGFPEWWAGRAAGTAPFLEWSYLLAWMLVAAALLLAAPLVGLPLRPLMRKAASGGNGRGRNMARGTYFSALGLAFLFLEIVFIQKFILFLGHPVVSMAVVVPAFLIFAGMGSGWSETFQHRLERYAARHWCPRPVMTAVLCMAIIAGVYAVTLPVLFEVAAGWPMAPRIIVSIGLIGILAIWMGIPFPLGLKRLGENNPAWIPLAWGINGMASVVSAVGAGLLAMHAGFRMVTLAAILFYLVAARLEKRL